MGSHLLLESTTGAIRPGRRAAVMPYRAYMFPISIVE